MKSASRCLLSNSFVTPQAAQTPKIFPFLIIILSSG